MVNLEYLHRFREITEFIDEKDIFVTRTEQNMSDEDVKTLGQLALGLFPTNTHAEMIVGYYDYMQIFFSHFPASFKAMPEVEKLFNDALKINKEEFEKLYLTICDWKKSHQASMNIYSKEDMLSVLSSQNELKSLAPDFFQKKNVNLERGKLQLALSTYQDTVEIEVYLDFLLNLINIINGKDVIEAPFSVVSLPPRKAGGKARKINSLSEKIDFLDGKLPFDIKLIYNTHLRNAIAHNEIEIRDSDKLLVFTKYSEQITFNDFHLIFKAIKDLHGSINTLLSDYQIAKARPTIVNQGLGAAVLGYTDFFENDGKLHPKAPCDAQLNIYQYWDFIELKHERRIFPSYELRLDYSDHSLKISFGETGALFCFPKGSDVIEWLEQLIVTNHLHVVLYTIAPILPFFVKKAIMRAPIGGKIDVYVLSIDEQTISISDELMKNTASFLGY